MYSISFIRTTPNATIPVSYKIVSLGQRSVKKHTSKSPYRLLLIEGILNMHVNQAPSRILCSRPLTVGEQGIA